MKLINCLLKTSVTVILLAIAMTSFVQAKDVSISEFVKLDFEKRVAICAQIVSSNQIGDCASISPPQGEPVSSADIMKISSSCFSGTVTDSQTLGTCVRDKLDANNIPVNFPSKEHIIKAYNICAMTVASSELGACTASLCTRL